MSQLASSEKKEKKAVAKNVLDDVEPVYPVAGSSFFFRSTVLRYSDLSSGWTLSERSY
jgi:hypothetical protein